MPDAIARTPFSKSDADPGTVPAFKALPRGGGPVDPLLPDSERRRINLYLARNVASARTAAGWTQDQLARAAELSRATIHLIEAGAGDPRLSTVIGLATALGRSTASLIGPPAPTRAAAQER